MVINMKQRCAKIYTTIDSHATLLSHVNDHMKSLQKEFFNQNTKQRNPNTPFLKLKKEQIEKLLNTGMRRSERWRKMRYDLGKPIEEIISSFNIPIPMKVFSWEAPNYEVDTIMTPMDSMRYYKSFLRAGLMSMEPQTGFVKAWVGGINYKHFQYDMVKQGKRQVGSTFKPLFMLQLLISSICLLVIVSQDHKLQYQL